MRFLIYALLLPAVLTGCNDKSKQQALSSDTSYDAATDVQHAATAFNNTQNLPASDELTIGALRLKQGSTGTVKLYDAKGQVTDLIALSDETQPPIAPWAIKTDYGILVFRVIGQNDSAYQVIADEEKKRSAFLKKNDQSMEFQTWDQHILKTFSIEANLAKNPLHIKPDEAAAVIDPGLKADEDVIFYPAAIQGDWLQVTWGSEANEKKAWIRWKHGSKILIQWYYLS